MKYDINLLNSYVEKGLLVKNNHPNLPISIWNYSRECQFEKKWDNITLNMRGTVLDEDGNVIARSFPKFFNWEELTTDQIPNEPFEVFEKLDGSLGILFHYNSEWHMATKGSFVSDQALRGKQILNSNYFTSTLVADNTYLFEIIFKENRIVCEYDYEDIVLLATYNNETGEEIPYENLNKVDFSLVKKYDGITDYKKLKQSIDPTKEGYVIRFKSGFRMKIKGEEYVRLHRLITNFSNVDIWEYLKDGKDLNEFLDRVPDEFDSWVRKTINDLKYKWYSIYNRLGKDYDYYRYGKYRDVYPEPTKKEYAEYVTANYEKPLQPVMFALWEEKQNPEKVRQLIWKLIKPKYQKPFWNKED